MKYVTASPEVYVARPTMKDRKSKATGKSICSAINCGQIDPWLAKKTGRIPCRTREKR
ncbi:MAG: hypothetical protein AW09_003644 [Candidatus Accumulibacter phosphatis]|jgi:hypothetical protein|uniref:Uncharacterized protein n=1 Tax=Candidatus Accumulibacter phosphatis TaxID=327160 RepID=A0A080LSA8_9PROT|nr:MAG: hypothetical protein AW09_003644 [Candidatus Accumulibacter phosphatis]MBL8408956.1 hypothetical protein [Accumulibacter sp.]